MRAVDVLEHPQSILGDGQQHAQPLHALVERTEVAFASAAVAVGMIEGRGDAGLIHVDDLLASLDSFDQLHGEGLSQHDVLLAVSVAMLRPNTLPNQLQFPPD